MNANNDRFFHNSLSLFGMVSLALLATAILVSIFVVSQAQSDPKASMVRVLNESGIAVKNICLEHLSFGDLPVSGISRYQSLATAYPYASLRLEVNNKTYEWWPTDHYGEIPAGKGYFTYRIRREDIGFGPEFIAQMRDNAMK
jgi:hypothetical protein